MIKVGVDLYGGEKGPTEVIKGAHLAIQRNPDIALVLYGSSQEILDILRNEQMNKLLPSRLEIQNSIPLPKGLNKEAIIRVKRNFPNSSIIQMLKGLDNGIHDVGVSSGDTRVLVAAGNQIIGRIRLTNGTKSTSTASSVALGTFIPKVQGGKTLMLDLGGQLQGDYFKNALLAYAFLKAMGIQFPTISLLNIGSESDKGTEELQKAFRDLEAGFGEYFYGNIEANHLLQCKTDIVVTDASSGNIALKAMEGTALTLGNRIKRVIEASPIATFGALFNGRALSQVKSEFDPRKYGGAPLLGLEKPLVKSHGNSDSESIATAIQKAYELAKARIIEKMKEELAQIHLHS